MGICTSVITIHHHHPHYPHHHNNNNIPNLVFCGLIFLIFLIFWLSRQGPLLYLFQKKTKNTGIPIYFLFFVIHMSIYNLFIHY